MAEDKEKTPKETSAQNNLMKNIQDTMTGIYRRTMFTEPDSDNEIKSLGNRINASMDKMLATNNTATGLSRISSLYSKLYSVQNDPGTVDGFKGLFEDLQNDGQMYSAFFNNRTLKQLDSEIDMVCKYMPKLEETIKLKVDNILYSDHFDFSFLKYAETGNFTNATDPTQFESNINIITEKYNMEEFLEDNLYNVLKYGETFVYCVPYDKAIRRLMSMGDESNYISESVDILHEDSQMLETGPKQTNVNDQAGDLKIELEFNTGGFLPRETMAIKKAYDRLAAIKEYSINLEASDEVNKNNIENKNISSGLTPSNKLDMTDYFDNSKDGFVNVKEKPKLGRLNINGSLIKRLDRYNIIPVYVDEICLGYYYIEDENLFKADGADSPMYDTTTPLNTLGVVRNTEANLNKNAGRVDDSVLKLIAQKMSAKIDARFINLHKDFTKEIYAILKTANLDKNSASRFRVTFLPPDDVTHCYFRKDPVSKRGISSIFKSLIPAKLWVGLQITNTLAIMSRSQDRRVYYVKNSGIDTNISKLLLNTIKQIKMNNFNIRQLENMKNVLNIIGRFNDFVIPVGPSGDAPVQFEIMQGQDIDPQTDLMNSLEEQAVNAADVPLELLQSRQTLDYAVQASMSNSRFLKHLNGWQAACNRWHSNIYTLCYRNEYNDPTARIKMELPKPSFLYVTNTNQIMDNANNMAMVVAEITSNGMSDEEKQEYAYNLRAEYIKAYIDQDMVKRVYDKTRLEHARNSTDANSSDAGGGGSDTGENY